MADTGEHNRLRAYYHENPLMVSSPFGGVDGINRDLLVDVLGRLGVQLEQKHILDVGCGRGYTGDVVRELGGSYTGVDFVPSRPGFRLVLGDATQLPFPNAAFDGVFCVDAFEHFPDVAAAAAEFRRVLRRDGFVFLSAPQYGNVAGLVKQFCERFGRYGKDTWAPFRGWQPQELEHALTARQVRRAFRGAGFTRLRRIGHAAEAGLGLFPWIEHPGLPEAIKFRLQRLFGAVGPCIVGACPGASLHGFWKIEV